MYIIFEFTVPVELRKYDNICLRCSEPGIWKWLTRPAPHPSEHDPVSLACWSFNIFGICVRPYKSFARDVYRLLFDYTRKLYMYRNRSGICINPFAAKIRFAYYVFKTRRKTRIFPSYLRVYHRSQDDLILYYIVY